MNTKVSEFYDNYCGAGCDIELFRGMTAEAIAAQILTVNPDEQDALGLAQEVVEYLTAINSVQCLFGAEAALIMAENIYDEAYDFAAENQEHRNQKLGEICDWLRNGDNPADRSTSDLAWEWLDYDSAEPEVI